MGAATYTYTVTPITVIGNKRLHRIRYIVSSYGTDGLPLTPTIAGMAIIDGVVGIVFRTVVANGPVVGIWDETNKLIYCHKASDTDVDAATVFNVDVFVMGS